MCGCRVSASLCIYTYIHICIYMCVNKYLYICVCIHMCMYIYIYLCVCPALRHSVCSGACRMSERLLYSTAWWLINMNTLTLCITSHVYVYMKSYEYVYTVSYEYVHSHSACYECVYDMINSILHDDIWICTLSHSAWHHINIYTMRNITWICIHGIHMNVFTGILWTCSLTLRMIWYECVYNIIWICILHDVMWISVQYNMNMYTAWYDVNMYTVTLYMTSHEYVYVVSYEYVYSHSAWYDVNMYTHTLHAMMWICISHTLHTSVLNTLWGGYGW